MKRDRILIAITLLFSLLLATSRLRGQEPDELKDRIIKSAWEALFGDMSPEQLQTIYYESYFHGRETPGRIYLKRPDRFRNETGDNILIFDGKRAAIIDRSEADTGGPGALQLVDSVYLAHFEVDIALAFPAFFEYPSEYRGISGDGAAVWWELYVELPRGGSISYFIDTCRHVVSRRLVSWEGDPEVELWENIITGYNDYEGILFESGYSFTGREGREEGYFRNARFNMDFKDSLFRIPDN